MWGHFTLVGIWILCFLYPFIKKSSKMHMEWVNDRTETEALLPLRFVNRIKLNTWLAVVIFSAGITGVMVGFMLTCSEVKPFEFMRAGDKTKFVFALFLIPFTQSLIDLGLLYISSYLLRIQLPVESSGHTLIFLFLGTFTLTATTLTLKAADVTWDMLAALALPLYKLSVVYQMIGRDIRSSQVEIKSQVVGYDLDFPRHSPGTLVRLYRIYRTFKSVGIALSFHMIS
jgi:hypothetical protein